jgi:hypothetical protein
MIQFIHTAGGRRLAIICESCSRSIESAADWIDRNQLGRRNLSKQDYKLLLGRRYNRANKGAGAPRGNENRAENNVDKKPTLNTTAKRLAAEHDGACLDLLRLQYPSTLRAAVVPLTDAIDQLVAIRDAGGQPA